MQFDFSPYPTTPQERRLQRIFEILPGALSWTILLGLVVVSWIQPVLAAVLIIAFDLYWLLRVLYMTLFLVLSSIRLSLERHTTWMARVRAVDRLVDGKLPSAPDPAFGPRPWPWARWLCRLVRLGGMFAPRGASERVPRACPWGSTGRARWDFASPNGSIVAN